MMKRLFLRMITLILTIIMLCGSIIYSQAEETNQNVLLGDSNSDTVVNVLDATVIQKYKAKLTDINTICFNAADVDFDKEITIMDATMIQKYLVKMINSFSLDKYLGETEETTDPSEIIKEQFFEENGNKYKIVLNENGDYIKYKWIIDQESYIKYKAIEDVKAYSICNVCGADVTGFARDHIDNLPENMQDWRMVKYHYTVQHCSTSWHVEYETKFLGYEEIEVSEEGHWEKVK